MITSATIGALVGMAAAGLVGRDGGSPSGRSFGADPGPRRLAPVADARWGSKIWSGTCSRTPLLRGELALRTLSANGGMALALARTSERCNGVAREHERSHSDERRTSRHGQTRRGRSRGFYDERGSTHRLPGDPDLNHLAPIKHGDTVTLSFHHLSIRPDELALMRDSMPTTRMPRERQPSGAITSPGVGVSAVRATTPAGGEVSVRQV
jgi:hypothetical protein